MNSGSVDHLGRKRASYATCSVSRGNNTRSYGIGKKQLSLVSLKQTAIVRYYGSILDIKIQQLSILHGGLVGFH